MPRPVPAHRLLALGATLLALGAAPAQAQVPVTGSDPGAGESDPRPNSNTAALAFDAATAALGPRRVITFEEFGANSFPPFGTLANPLDLGGGVTYAVRDPGASDGIDTGSDRGFGYNTTAGGRASLRYGSSPESDVGATFSFVQPVGAFGAYFTGVQRPAVAADLLTFALSDGTTATFSLAAQADGGVQFFGYAPGAARTITSVTLRGAETDGFGIDDVRVVGVASVVPEPGTWALVAGGLAVLGGAAARRRRAAA